MKPSVLLVEDDLDLCTELGTFLSRVGFNVRCANTLAQARAMLDGDVNIVVLDINLPDGSGVDLCLELRDRSRLGIVMCTAQTDQQLRITSLLEGADAYLAKPVDPYELIATLMSLYRRLRVTSSPFYAERPQAIPWRLDVVQHLLIAPNTISVSLTVREMELLKTIFLSAGRSVARETLMTVFGSAMDSRSSRRMEVMISRLRQNVWYKTGLKLPLVSEYGKGYGFSEYSQTV